jgi:hypothetical protein
LKIKKESLKIEKIRLSFSEKVEKKVKEKPKVQKRKINVKKLTKERKAHPDKGKRIELGKMKNAWIQLFEKCYDSKYKVSKKESSVLSRLFEENHIDQIVSAMIAMFWSYTSDEWFLDKNVVPNINRFGVKFDYWKSLGYKIQKFVSVNGKEFGDRWWVINEAKIPDDELEDEEFDRVLKVAKEQKFIVAYKVKDGKVSKNPVRRFKQ